MEVTRPVLRYFGGKWKLAPWIISHFPPHKAYVEPFGGAASVLMRKARSYAEVYNDLDGEVVNLFRILRDKEMASELERRMRMTPFARDEFNESYGTPSDDIDRARYMMVRAFMGFGSDGHNADAGKTGFRANSNRSGTTPAHDWANFPDQIMRFSERLYGVVIENRDALEVMSQQDSPETLHFVDPPYVHDTRGAKHSYRFEMSDKDHERLCEFLIGLKGLVILCGYRHPIYDRLGWETRERETHADGARERTEVIWMNESCARAQAQLTFKMEA